MKFIIRPILIMFMIFLCVLAVAQKSEHRSKTNLLTDIHWMIERSHIDTVRKKFTVFVEKNKLKTGFDIPDGDYYGETPYDDFDYKHVIDFTVKDGKIVFVDYDELFTDGHGKQSDTAYCRRMSITGTDPSVAYPIYEKQLLDKQDYMKIDAVSGASYTHFRFRLAVINALMGKN